MVASRLVTAGVLALFVAVGAGHAAPTVSDGAPIPPEFAETLYARVRNLRSADGCRLTRFDTSHYRISIGLESPGGTPHVFELATKPALIPVRRRAGEWAIGMSAALADECPQTVATLEGILGETAAPAGGWHPGSGPGESDGPYAWLVGRSYTLIAATYVVVLVGTALVLAHGATQAPAAAVAAVTIVWLAALGLRLSLSPRTFLHEYYHIAETVPAYLSGELAAGYGRAGPALFRLVGRVLGLGEDVRVIFLTNAVASSLAVPAAALLVTAVFGAWVPGLCAATLLAVLPQHLRFSAAEDLMVLALTLALWSLALFAGYQRTRRFAYAVLGAMTAALATQSRPEMILFPGILVAFLVCNRPHEWRRLFAPATLAAGVVLGVLLIPHVLDVLNAIRTSAAPAAHRPPLSRWIETLTFFDPQITPLFHRVLIAAGAAWALAHRPAWLLWVSGVYAGFTLFTLSMFDNPQYHMRAQNLPNGHLVLLGAGAAALWTTAWQGERRQGLLLGLGLLSAAAATVAHQWRDVVGALKDQQLEWAFLERRVPDLPAAGTLLTAVETGGRNLDAFPEFLLQGHDRRYALVDVRRVVAGTTPWPAPAPELLFYQGMFCYFAFADEPAPDPMTPACRAVHERYVAEPLAVEDLDTEGYSLLRYTHPGRGTYRIGFFRLTARR